MFALRLRVVFGIRRVVRNGKVSVLKRAFSSFQIHPAIGIARLGDALLDATDKSSYYDAPKTIGGLPTEPSTGDAVTKFRSSGNARKDSVRAQAAVFNIYNESGEKVDLEAAGIKKVTWSVWLANKKAAFYDFRELQGNPLLSDYWKNPNEEGNKPNSNSYEDCGTPKRNASVVGDDNKKRQDLIIDFGPRSIATSDANRSAHFGPDNGYEIDYKFESSPKIFGRKYPADIDPSKWHGNGDVNNLRLGSMMVEANGTLRVLGGDGTAVGQKNLETFAGADLWWDDISDGPVRAVIEFNDPSKEKVTLTAWCMIGSPKYAPELVNVSTLDDVIYDAAVRYNRQFCNPNMVKDMKFNLGESGFKPMFERDIKPILERMKNYQWAANVASMTAFANPPFNVSTTDSGIIASEMEKRKYWFSLLREAFKLGEVSVLYPLAEASSSHETLFSDESKSKVNAKLHFPLMPLNSGDNSVMDNKVHDGKETHSNQILSKFATVTPTQYYFLYQWAYGFVGTSEDNDESKLCNDSFVLNALDRGSSGNCVGYPASPGIETTWNTRVPWIYEPKNPTRILYDPYIFENKLASGLTALRDECEPLKADSDVSKVLNCGTFKSEKTNSVKDIKISGKGLEPGDLTKRMAIPWQADFSNCTVQDINFRDPSNVRGDDTKPAYYAYWWPPQSPWNVYLGYEEKEDQEQAGWGTFGEEGSGQQVFYQRGIMEYGDKGVYDAMIKHWKDLGFIINESGSKDYPYFVEKERNLANFEIPPPPSSSSSS